MTRSESSRSQDGERELLLERSEELARIESALDDACSGRGRLVVVEGPPGIGKTALIGVLRSAAAERGMRVLRSRGTELEREFGFGVVRQLLERPLAEATEPDRAELLQSSAGVAAGLLGLPGAPAAEGPASGGVDPSFTVLHGLYWICANLAAAGPLCVIVDDAHLADAPSLRFLAFLLTRLEELEVAVVVAARPREEGTDAALLAAVTADPSAEVIRLPPLTRAAVAQLVKAGLAAAPDPAFVDACLQATRGTPFLLRALVNALREDGVTPSAEGAGRVTRIGARSVGRSLRLRLRRLPEPAGRLARALAILEQSDLQQAARLAGIDEDEAAGAAELLVSAGIVESGRPLTFVHPIVRTGIYSELSDAERAQGHGRAARLLAETPGAGEAVAEHLLVSEPAGDAWVVEQLRFAARAAVRKGAPEPAAIFLGRALVEPPAPGERQGLLLELGTAEASAGLPGWDEHLGAVVDSAPDAEGTARAALVFGRALSRAQRFAEAVEILDRAASRLDSHHAELAVQLEASAVVAGTNDLAASPAAAARRRSLRERATDDAAPAEVLATAAFISILTNEPADVGAALANRALLAAQRDPGASDGRAGASPAASLSLMGPPALLWAERYSEMERRLDGAIGEARTIGDSGLLAIGLANRSWLALRRGDLGAAESDARTALAATALPAPPMYRVLNAGLLVETLVERGELDEAEQLLTPLRDQVEGASLTDTVLRFARGKLQVARGRNADGLDDFLGVGAHLTRGLVTCPSYLPWRSEAALAQAALGNPEPAVSLAEEELELARAFGTPRALGVAGRAAGVVAGGERGERLLRDAVEALERAGARLERARALADLGAMLRRRNRRTEARQLLREALDAAHRAGARRLADRAETELRATGARPRRAMLTGLDSLTASERRIAELAGQGLTNREIAQTLFITTRTVEGHLTSVFRKLRLGSRDDLPAALGRDGAPAPT